MKSFDTSSLARAIAEHLNSMEKKDVPAFAKSVFDLLQKQGLGRKIPMMSRLIRRMAKRHGPINAVVETPLPLTKTDSDHLSKIITQSLNKSVALEMKEVPSLIGGVRIQVGDDRFDYSVRGALNRISSTFSSLS